MAQDPLQAARAEQQARRQAEIEQKLNEHVQSYPLNLAFPANVLSPETAAATTTSTSTSDAAADDTANPSGGGGDNATSSNSKNNKADAPRTTEDFVNHRLLESGVLFDDLQSLGEASAAVARFVDNMNRTGCYDAVQVAIGRPAPPAAAAAADEEVEVEADAKSQVERRHLDVVLTEKRWYKLYVGGGIKHEGIVGGSSSGSSIEQLPRVQMETSAGLLNFTGCADVTSAEYTVDQTGATTLGLSHDRPLFSCFQPYSALSNLILTHPLLNGSNTALRLTERMDTVDWECARSSRDRTRSVGVKVCNMGHVAVPESSRDAYVGLEWSAAFRDVMPRRHATLPFACDASPEIVAQAGPSWKLSIA